MEKKKPNQTYPLFTTTTNKTNQTKSTKAKVIILDTVYIYTSATDM